MTAPTADTAASIESNLVAARQAAEMGDPKRALPLYETALERLVAVAITGATTAAWIGDAVRVGVEAAVYVAKTKPRIVEPLLARIGAKLIPVLGVAHQEGGKPIIRIESIASLQAVLLACHARRIEHVMQLLETAATCPWSGARVVPTNFPELFPKREAE